MMFPIFSCIFLMFTSGCSSPFKTTTVSWKRGLDHTDPMVDIFSSPSPPNTQDPPTSFVPATNLSTTLGAKPDSILSFLETVKNSAIEIRREVQAASENSTFLANKSKQREALAHYFLISVSTVEESASGVISCAIKLKKKIELMETETKLRLITARLLGDSNSKSVDEWSAGKSGQVTEAIVILTAKYSELSQLYTSFLSQVETVGRRLDVLTNFERLALGWTSEDICRNGMFLCQNGQMNITCVKYCNGHSECGDDSDEPQNCKNLFGSNCLSEQFRCDDGQCISLYDRCGWNEKCKDKSHSDYCY